MNMKWPQDALQRWGSDVLRRLCQVGGMGPPVPGTRSSDYEASERPAVNFLNSLSASEWQAFNAMARERTFARGAKLMQEGESADYVILILSGWVQIAVEESGRARVIAKRGPGQLVGERGALRVNVRSASVIALEPVHALDVRTADFASFISAYPRVLEIVENQIYDRLTEDPVGRNRGNWTVLQHEGPVSVMLPASIRQHLLAGENCTVVLTDIVEFGALRRTDAERRKIRQASLEMTHECLADLWETCICEDRGDGLLIVIPPEVPTAKIMQRIDQELPRRLAEHNRTYSEPLRIRLRVAVNVGPVVGDYLGISGSAIIRTARLVEAPVLKKAMASSTRGYLGIIISQFVYDIVIGQAGELINNGKYKPVRVELKETSTPAWMRLVAS